MLLIEKVLLFLAFAACQLGVKCLRSPHGPHLFHTSALRSSSSNDEVAERIRIVKSAERASRKAGVVISNALGKIDLAAGVDSKQGSRDIVTAVDKEAQDIIKQVILEEFPNHKFLGEEDVAPGMEASKVAIEACKDEPHLWIVDPIDGTTNFAHGMPLCGVIIAYAEYGELKYGLIYDPARDELFTAWKGQGAFLNGKRISCCSTETLAESVVCTGSPPNLDSLDACLRATAAISPLVRTVRMLGSASIMLSWVACGRLTSYFESDLNVWDIAAGALIIKEAGGKVSDVWGKEHSLSTRNLVASNGKIHDELLNVLLQARMYIE